MKRFLQQVYSTFLLWGFDPLRVINNLRGFPFYIRDLTKIKKLNDKKIFPLGRSFPVMHERFIQSASYDSHYFFQDLHAAQLIFKNNPAKHIDIGSRIDGFIAHLATFREVEVFDIRPLENLNKNIIFKQADLMILPQELIGQCESISSLHAIEHFGLGRYSDPIDPEGYLKAINNIHKMLKVGGKFYFSVPIGPQRIEFNAHRIFSVSYLLSIFENKFSLDSFSYVNDKGKFHANIALTEELIEKSCGCNYGCGIFELTAQ